MLYLLFQRQIKEKCDSILDGCLTVDELAGAIYMRIKEYESNQLVER
jgi:hypothetical protein